jgi:hypothetical protein
MRTLALLGLALAAPAALGLPVAAADTRARARSGLQMRAGKFTIGPGEDLEVCEYRRLPNARPMDVSGFTVRMPESAHHFALWSYGGSVRDDRLFPRGPFESIGCTGASREDPFPQLLIPTQSPNTQLWFPPGVALRLEPRQQVWLNPHMKNFSPRRIRPDIRLTFHRAKKGTVRHYAEGLTFGNMGGIHIPPGGDQTLTAEWTAPINLTLIHLSTHQHRLGTYARIDLVAPDGVTRETVVESDDWAHPGSTPPERQIRLAKGQKMRITCTWHNTDDHEVRFGPETTDEMCFAIGFYYRDPGDTEPVVGGGCLPGRRGLLCPLAPAVSN